MHSHCNLLSKYNLFIFIRRREFSLMISWRRFLTSTLKLITMGQLVQTKKRSKSNNSFCSLMISKKKNLSNILSRKQWISSNLSLQRKFKTLAILFAGSSASSRIVLLRMPGKTMSQLRSRGKSKGRKGRSKTRLIRREMSRGRRTSRLRLNKRRKRMRKRDKNKKSKMRLQKKKARPLMRNSLRRIKTKDWLRRTTRTRSCYRLKNLLLWIRRSKKPRQRQRQRKLKRQIKLKQQRRLNRQRKLKLLKRRQR